MPQWAQILIGIAGATTALGIIWTKLVRPLARFITASEEMFPLIQELTVTFKDTPHAFEVLEEIVQQVRTDSGSSLLDIVNRLETAALKNAEAAEALKVGVAADRQLAEHDRIELRDLLLKIDRVAVKVAEGGATNDRIEADRVEVADNLAKAQTAVEGVASDLAKERASHDELHETDRGDQ